MWGIAVWTVEAEAFADGTYLDIGTPDDLVRAVRQFAALADGEDL